MAKQTAKVGDAAALHERAREKLFFDDFQVIIIQLDAQSELISDEKVCKNFNLEPTSTFVRFYNING